MRPARAPAPESSSMRLFQVREARRRAPVSASSGTAGRSCCRRRTTGSPPRSTCSRRRRSADSTRGGGSRRPSAPGRLAAVGWDDLDARPRPAARPARRSARGLGRGRHLPPQRRLPRGGHRHLRPRLRGGAPGALLQGLGLALRRPRRAHRPPARLRASPRPSPRSRSCSGGSGAILGFTLANDVSAWDIERDNPLYLPQSKVYNGCFAFGPDDRHPRRDRGPLRARAALPRPARAGGRSSPARPAPASSSAASRSSWAGCSRSNEIAHRHRALDRHRHHPAARIAASRRATWSSLSSPELGELAQPRRPRVTAGPPPGPCRHPGPNRGAHSSRFVLDSHTRFP